MRREVAAGPPTNPGVVEANPLHRRKASTWNATADRGSTITVLKAIDKTLRPTGSTEGEERRGRQEGQF